MAQRDLTSNQRLCLIAAIAFVSKFQPELTGHERTDVITELATNGFVSVDFKMTVIVFQNGRQSFII